MIAKQLMNIAIIGAVMWMAQDSRGMSFTELEGLAGSYLSMARGISSDGTTVVGYSPLPPSSNSADQGFLWTKSGGVQNLGNRSPEGVSSNGTVVVGGLNYLNDRAWRWDANDGQFTIMPDDRSWAKAVNADGSVFVGKLTDPFTYGQEACVWGEGLVRYYPGGTDFYNNSEALSVLREMNRRAGCGKSTSPVL